ncbi:MAG: ATP-binding cassette domain-containing protein [Candidatus Eremiobacteraeota bacterium]|nr:ATP-binding cassette domain-containing protein [Candidatus Eremiobacteraeota bacterium]MBV8722485.1 ATP-binding cassette domain-containing protein [Candidatus Eremiobacteraeota bacterium]
MTTIALGSCALGRAIDCDGAPLDGGPRLEGARFPATPRVPLPNEREAIAVPLWTGVRAIDALLTIGRGARVGIFGAPGCGKSTLLETIVDGCAADAVVVALAGERGREARHWIDRRDARTSIVCATSDRPAAERIACATLAFAQATALRARGLHVLLVLDSLARFAYALRERAIATGERVGRAGYPPSVFAAMARFVEVAGPLSAGSITLVATVLSDGDERDPVSDAARSLLDGHVALSERLARAGRFPAIDVPASASRTMGAIVPSAHAAHAARVRNAIAALDRFEDARALGIEPSGGQARAALDAEAGLERFLRQDERPADPARTVAWLGELADTLGVSDGH